MNLERIVKDLQDLAEAGDLAVRRLRASASTIGHKQMDALRSEARAHLAARLLALASKYTAAKSTPNDAQDGGNHARG